MTGAEPTVVVIAVNYNQDQYTVDCIRSVLKSNYNNYHVILVDNGSRQDILQYITNNLDTDTTLTIEVLPENLGYVGGINYGLAAGGKFNPDYYLIMNNDTLIDSDSMSELVKVAEKYNGKAIVSGKVYHYDDKDTLQYIGQSIDPNGGLNQTSIVKNAREKDIGQYEEEMEMGMLDDIFWLMPSSLYKEIGGYSEYFFLYGEQNDYAFRAKKEGYKLIYTPKAKLWHKGGVSTCDGDHKSPKIEYWTSMAALKLAVLYLPEKEARKFCFRWPLLKFLKAIVLLVQGKTGLANIKAIVLARRHFKCWNIIRYKDNGYNPFNQL